MGRQAPTSPRVHECGQHRVIDALAETVWELLAGFKQWPGLLPHVTDLDVLDRRGSRTLLRVRVRPVWWCAFWVTCGVEPDPERRNLVRWYPTGPARGIVERWHVEDFGGDCARLGWRVHASGVRERIAARVLIEPLARQTADMLMLVAEADRQARSRYL